MEKIKMEIHIPLKVRRPFVWCMEREPQETQTDLNESNQNLKGLSSRGENGRKLNASVRSQRSTGKSHECSVYQLRMKVTVASNDTKRNATGKALKKSP